MAPLAWIGRISYGMYLYHLLILTIMARWLRTTSAANLLLFSAVVLAVAAGSYRWIESPFLRLTHRSD